MTKSAPAGDEMPPAQASSLDAKYGVMTERVENISARQSALETEMKRGFADVTAQISGLATQFQNSRTPQWQAISVMLVFLGMIGALVYWPIRESLSRLENEISARITRSEFDLVLAHAKEVHALFGAEIKSLKDNTVAKDLWNERTKAEDAGLASLDLRIKERREEHKALADSLGSGADNIRDLRTRVRELESLLRRPAAE